MKKSFFFLTIALAFFLTGCQTAEKQPVVLEVKYVPAPQPAVQKPVPFVPAPQPVVQEPVPSEEEKDAIRALEETPHPRRFSE